MIKTNEQSVVALVLSALVSTLALTSCGAGGDAVAAVTGGGISGSGNSVGSVQGFGSVIVNGTEFDTGSATITVEGAGATQSDLQIGQVVIVEANFQDLKASRVDYRAQIEGPVQSIAIADVSLGTATLTVLGQTVLTNAATNVVNARLDPAAANALAVGDLVELSGIWNANGALVASFLAREDTLDAYKVTGLARNVTPTTFEVGGLTVDYAGTGATPASNTTVEVKATPAGFDPVANTLDATSVTTVAPLSLSPDKEIELEGYITSFASASDFRIGAVRITTTPSTRYDDGDASSLGLNVKIEVEGTANASGILVAEKIEFASTGSVRIEAPVVSNSDIFPDTQELRLLGVKFSIRAETELDDDRDDVEPFEFSDIAPGDRIEMRGYLQGGSVIASEVRRREDAPGARLRGRVDAKDVASTTVTLLGVPIVGDASTQYHGASNQTAFFEAVRVGDFVSAEWDDFVSTASPADDLSLESD